MIKTIAQDILDLWKQEFSEEEFELMLSFIGTVVDKPHVLLQEIAEAKYGGKKNIDGLITDYLNLYDSTDEITSDRLCAEISNQAQIFWDEVGNGRPSSK
jgi:hypothetical protein